MNEFRRSVLKVDLPRAHKIRNSLGVYDAYKFLRKNKWLDIGQPLTEHQFYFIIRSINSLLALSLCESLDIVLPNKMGKIEVRKYNPGISIKDGKVIANLPIDWDRTLKLWSEDEEAYKKRILIKIEEKEIFKICYNRSKADFNNKSFYQFEANRELKKLLKKKIKGGGFDAFLL